MEEGPSLLLHKLTIRRSAITGSLHSPTCSAPVLSLPGAVPPGPLLAQKAPLHFAFFNSTILIQLIYCTCISFQKFEIFVKKIKAEIFQKSRGDETEKFINSTVYKI